VTSLMIFIKGKVIDIDLEILLRLESHLENTLAEIGRLIDSKEIDRQDSELFSCEILDLNKIF
jgi:hypothetical protein